MKMLSEIVAKIAAAVASMASAFTHATRTVTRFAFIAGRWCIQVATEIILVPVKAAAAFAISVPAAPQAEDAAKHITAQVTAATEQQEQALTVQQTARMLMRAARMRAAGHDITEFARTVPSGLGSYICKLSTSECQRIGEMDASVVMAWVAGQRPLLPGVRSRDELDGKAPKPSPMANTHEDRILSKLATRILERRDQPGGYTLRQRMAA